MTAAAAAIAGRHGLSPEGRFKERSATCIACASPDRPPTRVIDAANALAEEPEVVWAEPNLVATSEEDATD